LAVGVFTYRKGVATPVQIAQWSRNMVHAHTHKETGRGTLSLHAALSMNQTRSFSKVAYVQLPYGLHVPPGKG
jgi:hypothetical protein